MARIYKIIPSRLAQSASPAASFAAGEVDPTREVEMVLILLVPDHKARDQHEEHDGQQAQDDPHPAHLNLHPYQYAVQPRKSRSPICPARSGCTFTSA